jgi:RecJ-like exonuclease
MGRVRSIESYGIFVELAPNLAGLAELRGNVGTPVRTAVGDLAAIYIKSILPERMKVKLVIIDAQGSPTAKIPTEWQSTAKAPTFQASLLKAKNGAS